ncbi:hypothetical protein QYE76_071622 [Lolium multiflorum]|uniref:Uncharacterized protein n=1 Tax=Lolium multiflorum TaxID=4521 RepID=A0AAD8SMG1_LOLMU|nr:hypothetical protein QYE76_071622 [Lolium multiflorum]
MANQVVAGSCHIWLATTSTNHRRNHLPLCLTSGRAAEHASTGACRARFFSRGRHVPPLQDATRFRARTMAPSRPAENVQRAFVGENTSLQKMERKARIKKQLLEPKILTSAYDTAWVAMVPAIIGSSQVPCFPSCIEWILQNQQGNGSWGIPQANSLVNKDVMSSTLACVLALKKWNVGKKHIKRGLNFIGRNISIIMDDKIDAPIGFNVIFPGMLSLAIGMGLQIPFGQTDVDVILHLREIELEVPTVYPTTIRCQISMVDTLEKVGISQHFSREIKIILDMTYSLWLQRDEEIMSDVSTFATVFRILRMNGYDVSSDELSHVEDAFTFQNSLEGYLHDTRAILELYKASRVSVSEKELILDSIGDWTGKLLREKLFDDGVQSAPILGEVEYALKFPFYATMERLDHKWNIENFNASASHILKTEHLPCCVNQDILAIAIEDFSYAQSVYQDELQLLERWVKENKLDQLIFARQRMKYCYLATAATLFPPELSDARISWAKNSVLINVVDDFFDVAGSTEELENLVALVKNWDDPSKDEFCSEEVKILFNAIYTTTNQLGEIASAVQRRDVTKHLIQLWQELLRSMMAEADWRMREYVPTIQEYMEKAVVSFTLAPILLPASYFVGQKLLGCVVNGQEYNELFRLMGTSCRILNDIQGYERESSEEKLDSVSLLVQHSDGSMSIEEAKETLQRSVASYRKDLLRLVLKEDGVVPRECRDLFWKMCKICHLFYSHTDAFTSPSEMMSTVNAVINDPLKLHISNPFMAAQSKE